VIAELRALGSARNLEGMMRYGITPAKAFGVPITALRRVARSLGRDHALALSLWETGYHEARILATMVDEPARVTRAQMDRWAREFDSWDLCDQACMNLFVSTRDPYGTALRWSARRAEFVKRTGFALMAVLAVRDKDASDTAFAPFLEAIEREAGDDRNFVRKAVNWALRQIGKRNPALRRQAVEVAERIRSQGTRGARWIAADALRELGRP
jgi:3-methyladenine DNA glycosylase AlkD